MLYFADGGGVGSGTRLEQRITCLRLFLPSRSRRGKLAPDILELYVVSGLFAAITGQKDFTLRNQFSDLPLPCDETVYETANVSTLLIY